MTEQWTHDDRGASEDASGAPDTPTETDRPMSAASDTDDSSAIRTRGYAEDATDSPPTE